jgi:WhiB family redox-sensing transcriptional regulator
MTALRDASRAWRDRALCLDADPDLFFPPDDGVNAYAQTLAAKKVCAACPVRAECLEYAIVNNELWGVWGGVPERPRRAMRLQAQQAAAPRCRNDHLRTEANTSRNADGSNHCLDCENDWFAKNRGRQVA